MIGGQSGTPVPTIFDLTLLRQKRADMESAPTEFDVSKITNWIGYVGEFVPFVCPLSHGFRTAL